MVITLPGLVPAAVTKASIVIVSVTPTPKVPTVHADDVHDPTLGVTSPSVNPAGKASVTTNPVTIASPLFVTETVYVTVSPVFGVALSTIFDKTTSALLPTIISTAKTSSAVVGSV